MGFVLKIVQGVGPSHCAIGQVIQTVVSVEDTG